MSSISQVAREIAILTSAQLSARVTEAGLCVDAADDTWFPMEPTTDHGRAEYEAYARKACAGCPVRSECLILALRTEARPAIEPHGIWGGTAPWVRKRMLRNSRRRAVEAMRRAEAEAVRQVSA